MAALRSLLERGAAQEIFRTDVNAVDLYISITGLSYFYLANRFTLGFIFDQNLVAPNRLRQRRKHVATLVLDYLKYRAVKP
jgi:TetR/AcrR family transcriptional regulator